MSSTQTQPDDAQTATAEPTDTPSAARQLNEWRSRLDSFASAFDAEISEILTTLATLQSDEAPTASRIANADKTMEFTLPATPTPTPAPAALKSGPPQAARQMSMPESVSEPNRLAALKAKLSQQMASTGHPQSTTARTSEGGRS